MDGREPLDGPATEDDAAEDDDATHDATGGGDGALGGGDGATCGSLARDDDDPRYARVFRAGRCDAGLLGGKIMRGITKKLPNARSWDVCAFVSYVCICVCVSRTCVLL